MRGLVVAAHLQGQRALARRRHHLLAGEREADLRRRGRAGAARRRRARSRRARPRRACRSRVSTLPCSSSTRRSGRAASSWARRRRLAVPTRAPSGTSSSEAPTPIQASAGSSRAGTAAISSPSDSSPGRSLAECTPSSASPASTARSTPRTKRDLSPSSPVWVTSTSSAPPSRSATWPAWVSASSLPRVAIRSAKHASALLLAAAELGDVARAPRARARSRRRDRTARAGR